MHFAATTTLLVATVSAQAGVTCFEEGIGDPGSAWSSFSSAPYDSASNHEECKAAGDGDSLNPDAIHCLASINQDEVAADPANGIEGPISASYSCILYSAEVGTTDIRVAREDTSSLTYEAWAWGEGGSAQADIELPEEPAAEEPATEEDEEEDDEEASSVKMTATAFAAATLAMLAF